MEERGFLLSNALRPKTFDDVVGQKHITGKGAVFRQSVEKGQLFPTIFWGPAGNGKTTIALIACDTLGAEAILVDCTSVKTEELRNYMNSADVLILDEVQYLTKRQQQVLLYPIEARQITIIGCTTEYPTQQMFPALLDRCYTYKLNAVSVEQKITYYTELCSKHNIPYDESGVEVLANSCSLIRQGLHIIEMLLGTQCQITAATIADKLGLRPNVATKSQLISALQKSIRGSDPDASVYYLGQLLNLGELEYACRRLRIIVSEDIGLANSTGVLIVDSCITAALQTGMPEARIPLAHAVLYLALSPKSNSAVVAINAALDAPAYPPPACIASEHARDYVYPHDFKNHFYDFDYLPKGLQGTQFYHAVPNKWEKASYDYMLKIRAEARGKSQEGSAGNE